MYYDLKEKRNNINWLLLVVVYESAVLYVFYDVEYLIPDILDCLNSMETKLGNVSYALTLSFRILPCVPVIRN